MATALTLRPGDPVGDPPDNLQRVGWITVRGATATEADARAAEALSTVRGEVRASRDS
ncbi:hypothetical protein PV963_25445 [Streptomyces coeruleorubidus]|uniref:hypothetical protein n=1 Tax=Streptomyces coeruleorubidus TaxID=116188 RepID=UPI00237F7C5F|nr:hypothetical protein [Streptomyces coeruleorubidus]WDV56887.1 hypothetical protein PV963_25445 [Streptomyces coeruleorubidus]